MLVRSRLTLQCVAFVIVDFGVISCTSLMCLCCQSMGEVYATAAVASRANARTLTDIALTSEGQLDRSRTIGAIASIKAGAASRHTNLALVVVQ